MANTQIPARYRQVTEADLQARFDGLGLTPRCHVCGHSLFSLPLMHGHSPLLASDPDPIPKIVPHILPSSLGGNHEVVFPLTCERCGTLLLINADWIAPGSMQPQEREHSDE